MKNLDIDVLLENINAYVHNMYMTGVNQGKADICPTEDDRAAYQSASDERQELAFKAISDIMIQLGRQ